jgi:hypothetical protein
LSCMYGLGRTIRKVRLSIGTTRSIAITSRDRLVWARFPRASSILPGFCLCREEFLRKIEQSQQILDSLEGARRRCMAAGMPRVANACGGAWSIKAAIVWIRKLSERAAVVSIRRRLAAVTNSTFRARLKG